MWDPGGIQVGYCGKCSSWSLISLNSCVIGSSMNELKGDGCAPYPGGAFILPSLLNSLRPNPPGTVYIHQWLRPNATSNCGPKDTKLHHLSPSAVRVSVPDKFCTLSACKWLESHLLALQCVAARCLQGVLCKKTYASLSHPARHESIRGQFPSA